MDPLRINVTEYVVKRLGKRTGKRTERSNIAITREIFERMSLMPFISSIPIVHVAGTKGKGSTSALTAELLRRCYNFKSVALFQSPHLVDIRERVLINNQFIEEQKFLSLFETFEQEYTDKCDCLFKSPEIGEEQNAADRTHFFRTMFAFSVYAMKSLAVDAAVIEVGIGGRLDPTNIIPPPAASVVTCLGFDHQDILGDTIELIAGEKGGIYKKGSLAMFSAPQYDYPQTRKVLEDCALKCQQQQQQQNENENNNNNAFISVSYPTPQDFIGRNDTNDDAFTILSKLKGPHFAENAALAVAASRIAALSKTNNNNNNNNDYKGPLTPLESDTILHFKMDGRSQTIYWRRSKNKNLEEKDDEAKQFEMTFMIDGAHTVESVRRALFWAFHQQQKQNAEKLIIIFGTSRPPGPQLEEILKYSNNIEELICINIPELVPGQNSSEKCIEYLTSTTTTNKTSSSLPFKLTTADTVHDAIHLLYKRSSSVKVLVVGSMYSAGGAIRALREGTLLDGEVYKEE
jgi:folylpolyglutamate synthase/dihydrofolate synthase